MKPRKLTLSNQEEFFKKSSVGEIFTYSSSFSWEDVKRLAKEYGVIVEYCPPNTEEYNKYGSQTVKIVNKK